MTVIFHKAHIDKEKLRQIIFKNPACLQPGISFIDQQLSTEDGTDIDFLGVHKTGRLVVLNCDTSENEGTLVATLSQVQWIKKNEGLLKRLYFSENVDFTQPPQIILIGPGFPDTLKSAARQLLFQDIKFVEFKYIIAGDNDAIIFEEVFSNKRYGQPLPYVSKEKPAVAEEAASFKTPPVHMKEADKEMETILAEEVSLSPEEIAHFMDFSKTLEQNKKST